MNKNNVKAYLITESTVTAKPTIISDSKSDTTIIETILQEGDVPNRNKRIYPTSVLKAAMDSDYVKERLKTKSWYGEAGHPLKPDLDRQLYIDQSKISHIISEISFDKNILKGTVECAKTSAGKDMQGLIRQGSEVAFSMRGMGPISEKKGDILRIKAPLHVLTYDWVIHPSHKIAYMQNVLQESTMGMLLPEGYDERVLTEGVITPVLESQIKDYIMEESANVKQLVGQFEIDKHAIITLDESRQTLNIRQNGEILKVYIEDYVKNEIDDVILRMF